ncbi:MAG: glycosyltransferase family 2 protein [Granulosicoccus sp.]
MKTILCVCTYRRPAGLKTLLLALPSLRETQGLEIVVCDNDKAKEGIALCNNMQADYPFKIHTISAVEPGISAARNAATSLALSLEPDFIAFLDDDEWPEEQWLEELFRIQRKSDADAVGGPTRPVFPEGTSASTRENDYYGADLALADASPCQLQAGGNFLIKAAVLRPFAPDFFHPSFAHSGGEDLAFFTQLAQQGHTMFWAANAIVHEPVPESRLLDGWLRRRIINIHNSRVRVMQLLQPGFKHGCTRLLKTFALGLLAGCLTVVALVLPAFKQQAQMLRWKFQGKLTAHIGRVTVRGETY